jgi:hypothetical protein
MTRSRQKRSKHGLDGLAKHGLGPAGTYRIRTTALDRVDEQLDVVGQGCCE